VLYPAFEDLYVRHYNLQFTFGGGLVRSESCRRMAVSQRIADRVVTEAGWRVDDFQRAMLEGHDIDDEVAPVAWGQCVDYDRGASGAGGAGSVGGF